MRIALTSPHTHGKVVKAAQWLLKHNRFGQDFLLGKVDAEYGTESERGTHRAKYWLGYATRNINGVYGDYLNKFLLGPARGGKRITPIMLVRRKRRLKKAKQASLGAKALVQAARWIGTKERPAGSNDVVFSRWYRQRGPWCAMFVSYCLAHVGSRFHYAYVPSIVSDARHGRNGLQIVSTPKPGDLACFDWGGDGEADHVGFVTAVGNNTFNTIEGNTSLGSDSNGGEVMRRTRSRVQVQAFVRVGR